jgi:hypothetical protein
MIRVDSIKRRRLSDSKNQSSYKSKFLQKVNYKECPKIRRLSSSGLMTCPTPGYHIAAAHDSYD